MKKLYPVLIGICLFASCSKQAVKEADGLSVKIDTVRAAGGQTLLQYPGKVKAAQDITLAFRVSGTIQKVWVEEGAPVKKGQLLAELDPADYRIQLEATKAEYQQVKAEAERVIALYKDNGTTPNVYDKAVYGLQQITAKYRHHQDELSYTRLYAPFDGFVQKRLFKAHETVGAGMPVLSLVSTGAPEVEINLPAVESVRRDRFDSYACTFDVYPGRTFPLKFISITPKANANQLYTMRLQCSPDELPLPSPGMNTMVTIYCRAEGEPQYAVPGGAVLQQEGKTYVFVYNSSNRQVSRREVTVIRLLTDGRSLVTSAQLKPGEPVVASGVHHVKEGDRVKPLPVLTATNIGGLL